MAKSEPVAAWGPPGAAGHHGAAPLVHGHGGARAPGASGMTEPRGWVDGWPGGTQELLVAFSLLGELDEDEDEDEEKATPVRPGGLVAVFCPVRLLRQTGQLSCCSSQGTMQLSWNRWLQGNCRTLSPSA